MADIDSSALHTFVAIRAPRTIDENDLILASGELTQEHIEVAQKHVASGATLGTQPAPLVAIRHTHHRLAQLLATGVDETVAAKLCNYSVSRVSILKADPAFQELLSFYSSRVDEEWADFVSTAANLSMDTLGELQRRLDETPEQFSVATLIEMTKMLADRTGHAPVTKSVSVNVNADVGTRLAEARRKAQELAKTIGGSNG